MRIEFPMILSWLLFCHNAGADVVEPPPENCPPGSVAMTSHAGPYCGVDDCSVDPTSCTGEKICKQTELCISKISGANMAGPFTADHVVGFCSAKGNCPSGGTCSRLSVCIAPDESGGCSFSRTPSDSFGTSAVFFSLSLGVFWWFRRRRIGQ